MKLFISSKKHFLIPIVILTCVACENDWPTKAETKYLNGEWNLTSVTATDISSKKDTSWKTEGCFIRFGYTGRDGAAPVSYALTSNEIINILYSVPQKGKILFMPKDPVSIYENSKIGLQLSKSMPYEVLGDQLTLKGYGLIREGNRSIHEGRKMNLVAVFKKVK